MEKIDARGLNCPKPVIKTKKALENFDEIEVIVDNETASKNVKKLGIKIGAKVTVVKESDSYYKIIITDFKKADKENDRDNKSKVIFVKSELLGKGDQRLGDILIKGFIKTLLEINPLPDKIIFINSGVKLTCKNKDVIKSLKKLQEKDVEILSCGTCLDFYNLTDELKVGNVSNMYEIVESLNNGDVIEI
ncbi:MAG: sulfurtransferase-like selenium metabolism protein YedF [Bacillota bacterium]